MTCLLIPRLHPRSACWSSLGLFILLAKFRNGKYLRPIILWLSKIPWMRKQFEKASKAAIERQNPELASAMRKLERVGPNPDPAARAAGALAADRRPSAAPTSTRRAAGRRCPSRRTASSGAGSSGWRRRAATAAGGVEQQREAQEALGGCYSGAAGSAAACRRGVSVTL